MAHNKAWSPETPAVYARVETFIQHPARITRASLGAETGNGACIPRGLGRLSVGIEDAAGVSADLEQALPAAGRRRATRAAAT